MSHSRHIAPSTGPATPTTWPTQAQDPAHQAFLVLRGAFTLAPILFGADKFADLMVNWDRYLAPWIAGLSPLGVHQTMYLVGAVEIVAGIVVGLAPRIGAPIVSLWLLGIVVNLLTIPGYYDIALRDFGLLLAAVALWRLASVYDARRLPWSHTTA